VVGLNRYGAAAASYQVAERRAEPMHKLSTILNQPEYVHAAINHFPLIGLFVAMLALLIALVAKSRPAIIIGLTLVGLLSLSAWPVFHYGEAGYDRVLSMADEPGQAYLRHHEDLAEHWVFLYYITAGVAGLGLFLAWKWPRLLIPSSILSLLLATASLTAGIFIAQAGGQIRHREFRFGPPPGQDHGVKTLHGCKVTTLNGLNRSCLFLWLLPPIPVQGFGNTVLTL
jgi:hypothetical protein